MTMELRIIMIHKKTEHPDLGDYFTDLTIGL